MYHYRFEREGDIYVNSGTEEEPRWTRLMDFGEGGINITTPEENEPLVRSRDFGLADRAFRAYFQFPRQAGRTKFLEGLQKEDTMQDKISYMCSKVEDMLIDKNESYGNSALDPVRIFSDADPDEQLRVRIDDKLSRIQRGHQYDDEDTILDLVGYLILLLIAKEDQ